MLDRKTHTTNRNRIRVFVDFWNFTLSMRELDFIPLVEFLETRGIKVLHAAFPPKGAHLSRACWDTIDLLKVRPEFQR